MNIPPTESSRDIFKNRLVLIAFVQALNMRQLERKKIAQHNFFPKPKKKLQRRRTWVCVCFFSCFGWKMPTHTGKWFSSFINEKKVDSHRFSEPRRSSPFRLSNYTISFKRPARSSWGWKLQRLTLNFRMRWKVWNVNAVSSRILHDHESLTSIVGRVEFQFSRKKKKISRATRVKLSPEIFST